MIGDATMKDKFDRYGRLVSEQSLSFHSSKDTVYYLVSCTFIGEWRQYCLSSAEFKARPQPMNSDIIDPETQQLLEGLKEEKDFKVVNMEIYQLFAGFQIAREFWREAYMNGLEKKVPILEPPLFYLKINLALINQIESKKIKPFDLKLSTVREVSQNNTVKTLLNIVKWKQKLSKYRKIRVWHLKKSETTTELYNRVAAQAHSKGVRKLVNFGKCITNTSIEIKNLGMEKGDYFIIECQEKMSWCFEPAIQGRCENCSKIKCITFVCDCKKVGYCSEECKELNKLAHVQVCQFFESLKSKHLVEMRLQQKSARGLVGLTNLGNTCFLNSILQCLSHTISLTQYFLQSHYASEINRLNFLATKGRLVLAYANFIKNMWCLSQKTFSPHELKSEISKISPIFAGLAQHDCQEFFFALIDGLHEQLNRILKKPYIGTTDSKNKQDEIAARESWLAYTRRNQSIIVDLMTGLFKSKVNCPDCKKESVIFDPFITISLPLPEGLTTKKLFYLLLHRDNEETTKKLSITYCKPNPSTWLEIAAKSLGRSKNQFVFYLLSENQNIYSLDSIAKSELFHKIEEDNKQIFLIELTPQERQIEEKLELVVRFSKKVGASFEPIWHKRPFFFEKYQTTGLCIYIRILKYLYSDIYNSSLNRYRALFGVLGKTYKQYEEHMLTNRPFSLFLRLGKVVKNFYSKIQTQFSTSRQIGDEEFISDLLQNQSEYEVDVRFNQVGLSQFSLERLKIIVDCTETDLKIADENKTLSLRQCFEAFEEPEKLEKGNEWYCSECKQLKLAIKELTIFKAPEILILQLKRFKNKGIEKKQKNEIPVSFPFELDLTQFVIDPKPMSTYIPFLQKEARYIKPSNRIIINERSPPKYCLYAIVNHFGDLNKGHYTAFCKNNEKWFCFNDSRVEEISSTQMRTENAYVLFYQRSSP